MLTRRTIVVNASGNGDHTRIQWAIDNASDGDTVFVEAGFYHENLTISGKTINLIGEDNATTFIVVNENEICLTLDSSNCTITNYNFSGGKKNVIRSGSDNNTISCIIFNNNGLVLIETTDNTISSNTFVNSRIDIVESLRDRIENNYMETADITNIILSECLNISIHNNRMINGDIKFSLSYDYSGQSSQNQGQAQGPGQSGTLNLHLKEHIWSHSIKNNYLNEKLMYYNAFKRGFSVAKDAAWVVISKCSDFEIKDVETIEALYISDSERGEINDCTFYNCTSPLISRNYHDIAISNSSNIWIYNCHFMYSSLALWETTLSSINNNTMENNCVILYESINITLMNNSLSDGTIIFDDNFLGGQQGQQPTYGTFYLRESIWSHNINGNLIDGKPFCYYSFKSNFTVPSDAAWVIVTKCSDFNINSIQEQTPIHVSFSKRGDILNCNYFKMIRTVSYGHKSSIIRVDESDNIVIRDCIIEDSCSGIDLVDSNNIVIKNVSIVNCSGGINSFGNEECKILNNTVSFSEGIDSAFDRNGFIDNNTCEGNDGPGIDIGEGYSLPEFPLVLKKNYCTNNSYGILIDMKKTHSENVICDKNYCSNNDFDGIQIQNSGSIIRRNICNFNGRDGISFVWAYEKSIITRNTCKSNLNYGINISKYCNQNLIYHNNLIGNNEGGTQAFDNGWENDWDHSSEGNYWSDYMSRYPNADNDGIVWNIPYEIDGRENPKDHFPLCEPMDIDFIAPIAIVGGNITISQHQSVQFNARGSYGYPAIVNYTWSFQYDSMDISLYGIQPTFIFHEIGIYPVSLTIFNERGDTDTAVLTVIVVDGEPPMANAGKNQTILKGETATFDGTNSYDNIGIVNYTWSFIYDNESQLLQGLVVEYPFDICGNYSITLHVKDEMNLWDEDTIWVNVIEPKKPENNETIPDNDTEENSINNRPPQANAGENITIEVDGTVQFNGSGSWDDLGIINYTWQFIYNNTLIILHGPKPIFTFSIPGNYTITLRVTDINGSFDDVIIIVNVKALKDLNDNDKVDDMDPNIPIDDTPPDNKEPTDEEKDTKISRWIWIISGFLIFIIVIVIVYFIWMKKDDKVEQSIEEKLGRVEKSEDSDNE